MEKQLTWPVEASNADTSKAFHWNQPSSNLCLDFHGDPVSANLVVFSDGNHHMALEACCKLFLHTHADVIDIFYATTPPKVILESVLQGGLFLGNLHINVQPHVFISPANILDKLVDQGKIFSHQAFARSRDNVLLVKKGNPKNIISISDLLRDDVTFTISNPVTETASYEIYKQTLLDLAEEQSLDIEAFNTLISSESKTTVFGQSIHHREVPQTIYSSRADVALVYYHLALRYTRIFPDDFEFIEIENTTKLYTDYHIGLINDGGVWGQKFLDFMTSKVALEIYQQHGLQPA
jgi:accessory colonization factor AcfC